MMIQSNTDAVYTSIYRTGSGERGSGPEKILSICRVDVVLKNTPSSTLLQKSCGHGREQGMICDFQVKGG